MCVRCALTNLLILDRLEIYPNYRGRNFGNIYLLALIQNFGVGINMVALSAYPLQFESPSCTDVEFMHDFEIAREREKLRLRLDKFKGSRRASFQKLEKHYEKIGFQRVKGTDYMIKAN